MSEAYTYDPDDLLKDADIETADDPAATDDFAEPPAAEALYEPSDAEYEPSGEDFETTDPVIGSAEAFPADFQTSSAGMAVPRVAIQAFCENPDTARMIETAAGDRRLAKAQVTVNMGGLSTAIETFHDRSTPNLIIVETGMRSQHLFDQLEELAAVCDPETSLIVVGAANDITLYRELIKRGVSEYLVPPLTPVQLINAVGAIYTDPDQPYTGQSIAFVGAKGGAGSSTIAHNVGWCISENAQINSTIVDLDLPFGTAGLDFNQDPTQGVADALTQPERVDDVLLDRLLLHCTERLTLFSAPGTLDREWEIDASAYETVIDQVRRSVPYVILDLPHMWNRWMRHTLLAADDIVVTATPDLASLRNTKNLFDLVRANRPNDAPPKVVLNQVGVPKRPEIPVKDFCEALGVEACLVLPFDPVMFGKAANNGQMVSELDASSKAAEGMMHLARTITGRTVSAKNKSLISKLLGRS